MDRAAESLFSILPSYQEPLVWKGGASSWQSCKRWTLDYFDEVIECPLKFRLARKDSPKVQWEPDCPYLFASIAQFRDWTNGIFDPNSPFCSFPLDSWWAYAGYIYMDRTPGFENLLQDLAWTNTFNFLEGPVSPTFWLGSSGAYTPGHFDTYGVNLVVEIFGRKQWTLFPYSDTPYLYATRLPLEESTVFSEINLSHLNIRDFPLLSKSSPRTITLDPGDILFVPRNWWHFVRSADDSAVTCAVNLWIDQPKVDNRVRLREALTQIACFSLFSSCPSLDSCKYIHPEERDLLSSNWWDELLELINELKGSETEPHSVRPPDSVKCVNDSGLWTSLPPMNPTELFGSVDIHSIPHTASKINAHSLVKAFLHPDVIELVARHLEDCN